MLVLRIKEGHAAIVRHAKLGGNAHTISVIRADEKLARLLLDGVFPLSVGEEQTIEMEGHGKVRVGRISKGSVRLIFKMPPEVLITRDAVPAEIMARRPSAGRAA